MPTPRALLMCRPDEFDVVDVKNPFMAGHLGGVDRDAARAQWEALRRAFVDAGIPVEVIDPVPGCEDMVFCANQTFPYVTPDGERVCVLGRMRHASRQREVPAFEAWFAARGYRIERIEAGFEGGGDALPHPGGRPLVWCGVGPRTDAEAVPQLRALLGVEVVALPLRSERFYHLDTCLCVLDARRALVFRDALDEAGLARLEAEFDELIAVDEADAVERMACNALALPDGTVVLQRGAERTVAALAARGYRLVEVETGEFMKSGGSVYCLEQFVY